MTHKKEKNLYGCDWKREVIENTHNCKILNIKEANNPIKGELIEKSVLRRNTND